MKKAILSLLLGLAISDIALANFGEINAKFGLDYSSNDWLYKDISAYTGKGHSLSLEYLLYIPMLNFLKFGAGVEYLLPRKLNNDYSENFSACPVFITAQIHPFLGSLFIKGSFGRNVYYTIDKKISKNISGKHYYAAGVGYRFSFGFTVEFIFSRYEAEHISYEKNSLNFGYSLKT